MRTVKDAVTTRFSWRYHFILAMVGGISGIGVLLHFTSFIAGFVYLLPVLLISFWWGFREATVASVASVLCLDYFFTEPRFSLYMADRHDWVALCAFEAVAFVVSRLAVQAKTQAQFAKEQRTRFERLYRIGKEALLFDQPSECGAQLVQITREVLGADGAALWDAKASRTFTSGSIDVDTLGLRSWYAGSRAQGQEDITVQRHLVCFGERPVGVLCVAGAKVDLSTLDAVASLAAIALERTRTFEEKSSAEAARQSEHLRGAVLDGLAHAFKTPLTTIRTASSALLEIAKMDRLQTELVETIDQQAERLAELTTRLLTTAKLESTRLRVRRERVRLSDVIEKCGDDFESALVDRSVNTDKLSADSMVWADPVLLKLALDQIVDNAAKYGAPGTAICFSFREDDGESVIGVRNEGSFIPPEELRRVFSSFYRVPGSEHRAAGTGIGLSVAKRIVEAHKGSLWVESNLGQGTTFFFTLPHGPRET